VKSLIQRASLGMARRRTQLSLKEGELARLRRLLASTRDPGEKKRLQVIVWAAAGEYTLGELARKSGCARSTIQLLLNRFRERGLEGIQECNPPPGQISAMARPKVATQLRVGFKAGRWCSVHEVTAWLRERHSIRMQPKSVSFQLRKLGLVFRRPRPRLLKLRPELKAISPVRFAAKQRKYRTPEQILAHDTGSAAAAVLFEDFQGNPPDTNEGPRAIDLWLQALYELLESGELPLAQANACLKRLKKAWRYE
jgi:transposase